MIKLVTEGLQEYFDSLMKFIKNHKKDIQSILKKCGYDPASMSDAHVDADNGAVFFDFSVSDNADFGKVKKAFTDYFNKYKGFVINLYKEDPQVSVYIANEGVVEESKQLKRRSKSLIEKPVATSTKTTGYTERAIAIPKYEYSDIWEDGLEELLYDCKDVDDSVEWDIDYHGGMFGDTETLYLYSNGDTYEEIKYFIQQWRDKVMYESMKRRTNSIPAT